jgi:hypothetical protein
MDKYIQILISCGGGASFNIVKTANSLGAGLIVMVCSLMEMTFIEQMMVFAFIKRW